MLTDRQLRALTKKLEEMHEENGYEARARNANPVRQPEDQLALELASVSLLSAAVVSDVSPLSS